MVKKAMPNGHDRLEEAMALLIQNQAAFVARQAESDRELSALRRAIRHIEKDMTAILRVLAEHTRILERPPEAVRDKIGFKG